MLDSCFLARIPQLIFYLYQRYHYYSGPHRVPDIILTILISSKLAFATVSLLPYRQTYYWPTYLPTAKPTLAYQLPNLPWPTNCQIYYWPTYLLTAGPTTGWPTYQLPDLLLAYLPTNRQTYYWPTHLLTAGPTTGLPTYQSPDLLLAYLPTNCRTYHQPTYLLIARPTTSLPTYQLVGRQGFPRKVDH